MLKFNTLFPINSDSNIEKLIEIAKTWIVGSPHSQLTEEDISSYGDQADWEHQIGPETLSFIAGNILFG